MHTPSDYELYLIEETMRYGYDNSDDNEFPSWLAHEDAAYSWIFKLSRKISYPLNYHTVANELLNRIENIETLRFRKLRDISSQLKNAIESIVEEFIDLNHDLKDPLLWKKPKVLSSRGLERWKQAADVVSKARSVHPDPEWREIWEQTILKPYCTRLEAEKLAVQYIFDTLGINLLELDSKNNEHVYYHRMTAKDGIFKLKFGRYERDEGDFSNDIGVIKVDMLTRQIEQL